MKCPVCKTECFDDVFCRECGFQDLNPEFISSDDAKEWEKTVVEPFREIYWQSLFDFIIHDKEIVEYVGEDKNVTVPYGIESIGAEAFSDNKTIVNVFLPDTIKSIEVCAFYNSSIEFIMLSSGLEKMEPLAFAHTNIKHIDIPGNCEMIADEAFSFCSQLCSVVVKNGVKSIGRYAFHCCSKLNFIVLPATITEIQKNAFCTLCKYTRIIIDSMNQRYEFNNNCLVDKEYKTILAGYLSDEGWLMVPTDPEIVKIGDFAYSGQACDYVVEIPNNIIEIGNNAFSSCQELDVVIPASVRKIGFNVFSSTKCNIFCENKSKPTEWDDLWLDDEMGLSIVPYSKNVYWKNDWNNCPDKPESIFEQLSMKDFEI